MKFSRKEQRIRNILEQLHSLQREIANFTSHLEVFTGWELDDDEHKEFLSRLELVEQAAIASREQLDILTTLYMGKNDSSPDVTEARDTQFRNHPVDEGLS